MNNSKLGQFLLTAGLLTGMGIGLHKKYKMVNVALLAGLFAVGGLMAGNAVTKFYEE